MNRLEMKWYGLRVGFSLIWHQGQRRECGPKGLLMCCILLFCHLGPALNSGREWHLRFLWFYVFGMQFKKHNLGPKVQPNELNKDSVTMYAVKALCLGFCWTQLDTNRKVTTQMLQNTWSLCTAAPSIGMHEHYKDWGHKLHCRKHAISTRHTLSLLFQVTLANQQVALTAAHCQITITNMPVSTFANRYQ